MAKVKQSVIFISSIYGVGKSTLCLSLSNALSIPCFSAGDLISRVNGEKYGANKTVTDKEANQDILSAEVQKLLKTHTTILLAGHFCIFGKDNKIDILPEVVFENIPISLIILLEAEITAIAKHLQNRDGRNYNIEDIEKLRINEHKQAINIASKLSIPIIQHCMQYTISDVERLSEIIVDGSEMA